MKILPNFSKIPDTCNPIINSIYLCKLRRNSKKYTQMKMINIIYGCRGFTIYHVYRFIASKNDKTIEIHAKTFNRAIKEGRVKILS